MKVNELDAHLIDRKHLSVGDVRLVLDDNYKWLPDSSVDLILTDPPFNIARDTNFHTWEKNTINSYRFDADKGWDSYSPEGFRALLNEWSAEFARVLRPGGSFAVFCADEYISDLISALRLAKLKPRRTITWRKPNAVPVNRKHMMMSACEYIVMGVKGSKSTFNSDLAPLPAELTELEVVAIADKAATVVEQEVRRALGGVSRRLTPDELQIVIAEAISRTSKSVAKRALNIYDDSGERADLCVPNYVAFNSKSGANRIHPTEKPVNLLRYLIELFSNPGDLLLDPFAGSASLGETAISTGRQAVLVERDDEFFHLGSRRLQEVKSNNVDELYPDLLV